MNHITSAIGTLATAVVIVASMCSPAYAQQSNRNKLPPCPKDPTARHHNCFGTVSADGEKYVGEFKDSKFHGQGTYTFAQGHGYTGEWRDGKPHGKGIETYANGENPKEGIWENGKFIRAAKVNLTSKKFNAASNNPAISPPPVPPSNVGSTGDPRNWVQIGQTKDAILQLDANSILGFDAPNPSIGLSHRADFRYKGISDERLTSAPKTAFMKQSDCDKGAGNIAIFITDQDGNPLGRGETHEFQVSGEFWVDAIGRTMCRARQLMMDNQKLTTSAGISQRINLQVTHSQPIADGSFLIDIKTNIDTASLQIDGKEEGGKTDGNYVIKRVARAGQVSSFKIIATDVFGNTETKTIDVNRVIVESKATYAALNPGQVKQQTTRDAVAIIIGIADYKNLPKADFASDDARAFYDYAIRALGIKPENIKLLVDSDAEEVEILRTFRNWLPSKVRSTTDVYVFYSGHGLPTADGQGLYLIPPSAARDLIDDTAIPFSKINAAIQSAKPRSVTMILDACYSGQARSGESLVASARPVQLKAEKRLFPENFTVITASQSDQISSSNPELKHGIFSYYLMKGMEGDADANKDGKITLGEMQTYLVENVGKQAGMMSRKQEPQLMGDVNRILVGR
jgi:hypothetical protein